MQTKRILIKTKKMFDLSSNDNDDKMILKLMKIIMTMMMMMNK